MDRPFQRLLLASALASAGCSLSDFAYLSADFERSAAGAASSSDGAGGSTGGSGGSGGGAGPAGQGGTQAGSAGSGGAAEPPYFCNPDYAVFDPSKSEPPAQLPSDGNYVIRKYRADGPTSDCLLTPGWPELGDMQHFAITQACGGPGTPEPAGDAERWHFERLCSDVYRVTSGHDSAGVRQLGITDHTMVGTPLHSVVSRRSVDPSYLFQLRFEELIPAGGPGAPADQPLGRWRLSPLIQASSCVEQISMGRYGELDVTRVVIFPCTGSMPNQSWNLLAVP